jgi:hypothetical protein
LTGAVRTITQTLVIILTTSLQPLATIQLSTSGFIPTRVRLGILRPTGMVCMTWLGTCGSGAGIGMEAIRAARKVILAALLQARSACFAGAVGATTRSTAGRRSATSPGRATGSTTLWGSGPSCPQVSREQNRNSRGKRSGLMRKGEAERSRSSSRLRSGSVRNWKERKARAAVAIF